MTKFAVTAPQKLRNEAATITATVDPDAAMIDPMDRERMNCARNTMQLTIPTSVPMPRTCFALAGSPPPPLPPPSRRRSPPLLGAWAR